MARHSTRKEKALFRDLQAEVKRFRESPKGKAIRAEAAAAVEKLRRELDSRRCPECGTPADEIPLGTGPAGPCLVARHLPHGVDR